MNRFRLFTFLLAFFSLSILASIFVCNAVHADYYAEGTLRSANLLAGVTEVTSIDEFFASTSIPTDTSVYVKFSQNREDYYSSTGTQEFWEELNNGSNTVDLSSLSWSGSALYYKLKLETTRATGTPEIEEASVNYTGSASTTADSGDSYREGMFLSTNLVAGASVTSINNFLATTSIPIGTYVYVQFSENGTDFYSTSSVANAWNTLADGANNLDLSGLAFTNGLFYKLKLTSIDSDMSPEVLEVNIDYDGSAPTGSGDGDFGKEGYLMSTDLLAGSPTFASPAYFAYNVSALPGGTTLSAQFSNDGETWYNSSGTLWGWDSLALGSYLTRETAINLSSLGWNQEESFYYKLKFTTSDSGWSPEIDSAGLLNANAIKVNSSDMPDPIAYWKFNEGHGGICYDSSGNANNGTLYPGTLGDNTATSSMWDNNGKFGGAMELDGADDYIKVSDNTSLDITATTTISAWIKPTTLNDAKHNIIHKDGAYTFGIASSLSRLSLYNSGSSAEIFSNSNVLTAGVWQYVLVTKNSSGVSFYVNGNLVGADTSADAQADFNSNGNDLYLGIDEDISTGIFSGLIDEVKIYDQPLSASEIKSDYNQGASVKMGTVSTEADGKTSSNSKTRKYCVPGDTSTCNPPVLELKLDEFAGTIVYDESGKGHNGTLGGGTVSQVPTWTPLGRVGSALIFDGIDDYISVGKNYKVVKTVSFWLKADSANEKVIDLNGTANIEVVSGKVIANNFVNPTIYIDSVVSSSTNTNWHYVTITTATGINASAVDIGRIASDYFKGLIDHIYFYGYERTPAQIAWDYNKGKPVAEWNFDECSGDVIHDNSGNNQHGQLHIGSSGTTVTGTCTVSADSFWYNGRNGAVKHGAYFDGEDDYIDIGDTGLDINSVSFWFKQDYTENNIIDLDGGTHTITVLKSNITATGFSSPTIYIDGQATSVIPDSGWHHIVVTTATAIDANNMDIGRIGTDYFTGQLDEVKLYNYALTSTQAKTDFSGGAVGFGYSGVTSGSALVSSWTCGTSNLEDIDGNTYATVQIGTQCWMAENLMVTKNADGSAVDGTGDVDTTPPAAYGDTDGGHDGADANWEATEGYLYNWQDAMNGSTVEGAQGICMDGWHIPTHDEWTDLERYICETEGNGSCDTTFPKDTSTTGWLGTNEGTELKATTNVNGETGTDPNGDDGYGFVGLLTGNRFTDGIFYIRGTYGYFWSSSESGSYAWDRGLYSSNAGVYRGIAVQGYGLSVRCLKD